MKISYRLFFFICSVPFFNHDAVRCGAIRFCMLHEKVSNACAMSQSTLKSSHCCAITNNYLADGFEMLFSHSIEKLLDSDSIILQYIANWGNPYSRLNERRFHFLSLSVSLSWALHFDLFINCRASLRPTKVMINKRRTIPIIEDAPQFRSVFVTTKRVRIIFKYIVL